MKRIFNLFKFYVPYWNWNLTRCVFLLYRMSLIILTAMSFLFLGYNCIPDFTFQVTTTDVALEGKADTMLDWKSMAIIGGAIIGTVCLVGAGYYLYNHPDMLITLFKPWKWFRKDEPKEEPKTKDKGKEKEEPKEEPKTEKPKEEPKTEKPKEEPKTEVLSERKRILRIIMEDMASRSETWDFVDYAIRNMEDLDLWYNTQTQMPEDYITILCDNILYHVFEEKRRRLAADSQTLTIEYVNQHKRAITEYIYGLISDETINLYRATLNYNVPAIEMTHAWIRTYCRDEAFTESNLQVVIAITNMIDKVVR